MIGRTAAYGRAAFAWAVKRDAVQHNPFANLPVAKSIAKRERVLTDQEIAEIWRAAGDAGSPYGTIIRLLILTGQRRGEVAGMAWGEISDDLATWTLPGERTKNGAAHGVPLSAPARDILRAGLPDGADHRGAAGGLLLPGAFGTPFAGWSKAKQALDKAIMDARAKAARAAGTSLAPLIPWNVHDLRRTVATGLQRLGVRLEVTEAVLNHISGSRGGIAGVYQRHDWAAEKRAALDSWAAHVLAVAKGSPDAHKSGDIETSHGVNRVSPKAPGVLARREGPTPLRRSTFDAFSGEQFEGRVDLSSITLCLIAGSIPLEKAGVT